MSGDPTTPQSTPATPPTGLGRDQIWTPEIWAAIDHAVTTEVCRVRVAQKILPVESVPGAIYIPDGAFVFRAGSPTSIPEGATKSFLELTAPFFLSQAQTDNEATFHQGRSSARLFAGYIAQAEDEALFRGGPAVAPPAVGATPRIVTAKIPVTGIKGLLWEVDDTAGQENEYVVPRTFWADPRELFEVVAECINTKLAMKGHPGPYALVLESTVYANIYKPYSRVASAAAISVKERLEGLVHGGIEGSGALLVPATEAGLTGRARGGHPGDVKCGLLFSLAGDPVSIYVAVDAITAFTFTDPSGSKWFRVFERIQYVVRDKRALLRLEFQ
jgi:uncharacterized linocin/CFP29 family protein